MDSQPKSSGLVLGRRPLGSILHSSNEPGELSQWLCHDDSTINIVVLIIIIIIIIIRGNKYKLLSHTFHYNFNKFSFAARIVNICNCLPDYVVDVNSAALFKKRLDKFWADQNVMSDWTADITGTGDRSEYIVERD